MNLEHWSAARRAAGIAFLLASMGCGSTTNMPLDPSTANCAGRGCVDLLNFYATPVTVSVAGGASVNLAAPTNNGTSIAPGTGTLAVSPTLGAAYVFSTTVGTVPKTVTCTVTSAAWLHILPSVVVQQSGNMTCSLW